MLEDKKVIIDIIILYDIASLEKYGIIKINKIKLHKISNFEY